MATDLTGLQVRNTYNSLLKIGDNTSLTGIAKRISDGLGNDSPLFISTSQISIGVAPATGYDLTVNSGIRTGFIDVLGAATAQSLQFTGGGGTQGTMSWNTDEETVDLIQNGATLQLGQETHVHVKNQSGATINDGTPVYVTGTLGASGRLTVAPMIADGSIPAKYFLGVTTEDIPNGEDGKVTTFGKIRGLDTTAYTEGQTLYVSSTTAGFWQTTPPVAPALDLEVAIVINVSANNGTLFVRAQNGQYLGLLHDVYLNSVADNHLLVYNATNSRWENQGIASIGTINLDTVTDNGNTTTNSISVGDINAGNVTLTGYLRGAANFVIDPAAHGDETGVVQILGDLRVDGTTTTINSTTVTIADKNIVLAQGSALPGDANGAGITIDGAAASITYNSTSDRFVFNKDIETNLVGNVTGNLTGNADTASALETARNIAVDGAVTGNADFDGSANITITTTVNHNHDDRYYTETESDNRFVNVDGDTMTGNLDFNDDVQARFGTGDDFKIYHNATNTLIDNETGAIIIRNFADDQDIVLASDDGAGSITDYLRVDGSEGSVKLFHYGLQKLETTATGVSITGALSGNISTSSISGGTIDINGTTAINLQYNGSTQLRIDSTGVAYLGTVTFANDGISLTDEDSTTDSFFHANVDYDAGIYTVTSNARYGSDYIQVDGKDSRSGNDRVFVISPKDIGSPDEDAMLYLGGDYSITAPNTLVDWHTIYMNALSVRINNNEVATQAWVTSNIDFQDVTDNGATTTNGITVATITALDGGTDSGLSDISAEFGKPNQNSKSVLITNETGEAHTWFSYTDGSNYITSDTTDVGGWTEFRRWNGTDYVKDARFTEGGNLELENNLIVDGNIGVGVTPTERLHIAGSDTDVGIRIDNNNTNGRDYFLYSRSALGIKFSIYDYTQGLDRFGIDSAGNIIIGDTSTGWNLGKTLHIGGGLATLSFGGTNAILSSLNTYYDGSGYRRISSGTVGQIDYNVAVSDAFAFRTQDDYGSAGDLITLSPKMVLTSSGRLGIGDTSPERLLQVAGGISINNDLRVYSNTSTHQGGMTVYDPDGGGYLSIAVTDNEHASGWGYQFQNNYADDDTATAYFRVGYDGAISYLNSGNFAIGKTTADYKLDVAGHIRIDNNGTDHLYFGTDSNNYLAYSDTTAYWRAATHYFEATSGYKGIWDSSGNLGIGTTSPTHKLHVVGGGSGTFVNIEATDTTGNGYSELLFKAGTSTGYIWLANNSATAWGGAGSMNIQASGAIALLANTTERMLIDTSGQTRFKSGTDYSIGLNRSGVDEWWLKAYSNGAFAIHENGVGDKFYISAGGNTGIGTTDTPMKLTVRGGFIALNSSNGSSASALYISPTNENTFNSGYGQDVDDKDMWLNYRGYNDGFTRFRDVRIGNGKGTAFAFFQGSTQRVGIGNTSPSYKLDIGSGQSNYIRIHNAGSGDVASGLIISRGSSGLGLQLYDNPADDTTTFRTGGNVNFFYAGSSYNLFLDGGNGRVGLSTSSPNSKLHVITGGASSGYAGADRGILVTDINGARLILEHSGATSGSKNYVLRSESGIFSLALLNDAGTAWTADNIINANSSGNVGIGTAFPAAKLHVDGSIYTNGNTTIDAALTISGSPAINLTGSGTGTYNKAVIYNDQTYGFLVEAAKSSDSSGASKRPIQLTWRGGYPSNGGLFLYGSTKLYTDDTGLGIGTTSPQTYLDIVGNNSGSKSINSRAGNSNNGNSSAHLIMSWNGNPYNSNGYAHSIRTKHDGGSTSLNTIEFWLWKYGTDSASTLGSLEAMRIQGDGKLQVANDIIAFSTTVSDARLKDNVVTIDNALDKVKSLRGVEYVWNKGGREGQKDLGFIAQEVEQVIPEIVRENEMPLLDDSGEKYKTVDYEKMVAVLVEAIKEQQKQIDELKAIINGGS